MSSTRSRRPSASFVVAVAALVLATGSTSYAAGLARNSVGNAQLRTDAVSGSKVKDGALSGADVKDGSLTGAEIKPQSVGLSDLAASATPPRSIALVRELPDTDGTIVLLSNPDFRLTIDCDSDLNDLSFKLTAPDGGATVEVSGTANYQSSVGSFTSVTLGNILQMAAGERSEMTNAFAMFEGTVRPSAGKTMHLSIALRMGTIPAVDVCSVRFLATPIS